MAKANSLKDSMKGGLNALLSSTTTAKEPEAKTKAKTALSDAQQKETAVHCNFVINKSIHTRMKYLALEKNMSLRDIVNQAMLEYLERNDG